MRLIRRASSVALLAVLAAVAGCSSGPSKQDGLAAAAHARTQLVSELRSLYLKMYRAHFVWAIGGNMSGEYQGCPTSTQGSQLAYYGFFDGLQSFSLHINSEEYLRQATSLAALPGGGTRTKNPGLGLRITSSQRMRSRQRSCSPGGRSGRLP